MTTLAFVGGSSLGTGGAYTDSDWVKSTTGVALPTTGRIAANGNRPIYVSQAKCFWAGKGGTATLALQIGTKSSSYRNVASASVAGDSGWISIGYISPNGGNTLVQINHSDTTPFYFGHSTSTGTTTSAGGGSWTGALSGQVDYQQVPNAPTGLTVAQASLENAVNVSWTAPSDNGGSAITGYSVVWSYNSNMSGSNTILTGSTATSYKITGLTYGSTVYVKVAAINIVASSAGTTSVFTSVSSGFLTPPNLSLDGWSNFGTVTNNTFTISHTTVPPVSPDTGFLRTGTASATGGSYTIGTLGIQKTYTNLVVGRQYTLAGKAVLTTTGVNGNVYRFAVVGIGNGSSVTLTGSTPGTIPSYTFTATSTTHTVQIQLAETFTVVATGLQESVGFYDYSITKVATDLVYRVQDNMHTGSLVDHFDLATQSVGASWWVDKKNVTQFAQDFDYVVPTATFSDVAGEGNLYYTAIDTAYDTSSVINDITFDNIGRRPSTYGSDNYEEYNVTWVDKDSTSVSNWGARKYELTTNLLTSVVNYNYIPDPNCTYSDKLLVGGIGTVMTPSRQQLSLMATGATGFLSTGTTQPVANGGQYVVRALMNAHQSTIPIAYTGDIINSQAYSGVAVVAGQNYTASAYLRAGVGHATSLTGYVAIRWFNEAGAAISTPNGAATTITATSWTRRTLTATAPAGAVAAAFFAWFLYGGANNAGYRYYVTGAQLENGSTASNWFSGDTTDDATYVYDWEGTPGQSRSVMYTNIMDTRTGELLTDYANPIVRVNSLTWNTAQNPITAANFDIGSLCIITFKGTTATYRVVGINHDITPERWMMTLQVAKV